jgi:D-serine deaminase-like pyridoxal phosphate-dependent protein
MKITKPTLLISKERVLQNINKMLSRAEYFNANIRPHFKTHQSLEIGEIFRQKGITAITVSSVSMAEFFAKDGWNDITIAFPVNLLEIEQINTLAKDIKLNLLVDSLYSTKQLSGKLKQNVGVFIKIDVGYHRCGIAFDNNEIDEIVNEIKDNDFLELKGFLAHAGHAYNAKGKVEIEEIVANSKSQLGFLRNKYPGTIISYGDTPSCSMAENLEGFDELRPGNFVYYDAMQYHIGACKMEEIAVVVGCPVVSIFPEREEIIIYGGGVHLSKEFIAAHNNFKLMGYVVKLKNNKWGNPINGAYVSSLSQEHGVIKMPKKLISEFKPGDLLGIIPIHSCMSANLLKDYSVII